MCLYWCVPSYSCKMKLDLHYKAAVGNVHCIEREWDWKPPQWHSCLNNILNYETVLNTFTGGSSLITMSFLFATSFHLLIFVLMKKSSDTHHPVTNMKGKKKKCLFLIVPGCLKCAGWCSCVRFTLSCISRSAMWQVCGSRVALGCQS